MKTGSTHILRLAVLSLGVIIGAICAFALPPAIASDNADLYRPILLGLYVPAIPYFYALFQTMRLLTLIDRGKAFSKHAVRALRNIRNSAIIISGLFAAGLPYIYYAAEKDDAPGVILMGGLIVFASFVIATFAAVLMRVLASAIAYKKENDLTV